MLFEIFVIEPCVMTFLPIDKEDKKKVTADQVDENHGS